MEYNKKIISLIVIALLVAAGAYSLGKSNRESQQASVLSGIGTIGTTLPSNGWVCIVIYIDAVGGQLDIDSRFSPTDISGTIEGGDGLWEVFKDCIPATIKPQPTTTTPVSQSPTPINNFQQATTTQLIR